LNEPLYCGISGAACGVVLGLGNLLLKDEGFGVHAMQALRDEIGPNTNFEFVDGGVLGLDLLPLVEDTRNLLVLDALDAGLSPGSVIELAGDQIPVFSNFKLSQHQLGFQEVIGLAKFRGKMPHNLFIIGVQPDDVSLGLELSEPVAEAIPEVLKRAQAVLAEWI
jgi:hydrogenase maturation protease